MKAGEHEKPKRGISAAFKSAKKGDIFYIDKFPKTLTAIASLCDVTIHTSIVLVIENQSTEAPIIKRITKVIIT